MNKIIQLSMAVHVFLYRKTGGKFGAHFGGMDVLLLDSKGRKTGKTRTTPLAYFEHDGLWVITASNAGKERHPGWYYNLKHEPRVFIQIQNQSHLVCAKQADESARAQLWPLLIQKYPNFNSYQQKTAREIPMFLLEPLNN
jgi:F420H(2)-dependent quinone reductase